MKPVVCISHRSHIDETPLNFTDKSIAVIEEMLKEALAPFDLSGMVSGKRVFIKPNFVRPDYKFNPANCSDPRAVLALGKLVKQAGASRIAIGDNPGKGLSFRDSIPNIPGYEKWGEYGIDTFFYEDSEAVTDNIPGARLFTKITYPSAFRDFDVFINLAKIKMHMMVTASLGIKNLYGLLLDDDRMSHHRPDVNLKLIEILKFFPPDLTILEGIWALEGQAPICGEPVKDFNTIIAGKNPAAVDAVGASIVGIEPIEIATNRIAKSEGIGPIDLDDIEVTGAKINDVKRVLRRSVISSAGAYENCDVFELGVCAGCMNSMRHALDKLHYGDELKNFPKNTFILGIPGPYYNPLKSWEGILFLVGDCPLSAYEDRPGIIRVPGCPPHFGEIMDVMRRSLKMG